MSHSPTTSIPNQNERKYRTTEHETLQPDREASPESRKRDDMRYDIQPGPESTSRREGLRKIRDTNDRSSVNCPVQACLRGLSHAKSGLQATQTPFPSLFFTEDQPLHLFRPLPCVRPRPSPRVRAEGLDTHVPVLLAPSQALWWIRGFLGASTHPSCTSIT